MYEPESPTVEGEKRAKESLREHGPAVRVGGRRVAKGHPSRSGSAPTEEEHGFVSDPSAGVGALTSTSNTVAVQGAMGIAEDAGPEERRKMRRDKEAEVKHAHNPPPKHTDAKVQRGARTAKRMTNPMNRGTEFTGGRIKQ